MLKYHLESRAKADIDKEIKEIKSNLLLPTEKELGIPNIKANETIVNLTERKKDFEKRLYDFETRLNMIAKFSSNEQANKMKIIIEAYKTESSVCDDKNLVPLLGMSSNNWNFLLEGEDFTISVLGEIKWLE